MLNEGFESARFSDVSRLKELLEMDPSLVNAENSDGLTLLGFAAHFGQVDAVQLLLRHGADVNASSHSKVSYIPSNTALHAAIAGERNLDVIKLLLEHQGQTDIFDSNGHTCLHTAVFHKDNTQIIRLLLEYGADVNAKTEDGTRALAIAKARGNNQVAKYLQQHGGLE